MSTFTAVAADQQHQRGLYTSSENSNKKSQTS